MHSLFKESIDTPPLNKNNPPVSGAIFWERALFYRIKHTIISFQSIDEMMVSDSLGKAVGFISF